MRFYSAKLANGLTVIGEEQPQAVSVAMGYFVRAGARDETPQISGVSHFLEHMMFKGTATRSALDVSYALGGLGAQANAYTSEEQTVYYLAVLPEYFGQAFELLSDMLRPAIDPVEFDLEKKVILDEIALYQDRPTYVLFERAMREFFSGHEAGNSVLGTQESIGALSREQMKRYFDARYSPSNIILAVAGNFSWEELLEQAERHCSTWVDQAVGRLVRPHAPVPSRHELRRKEIHRAHLCLIAPGPAATEQERYAAEVLSCVLGDSTGSRVYWELIDTGLADSASIDTDDMDGTGYVYGYASCAPDDLARVEEILTNILQTPLNFAEDALQRARTKIRTRLVLQSESSMRRLMNIGLEWQYRQEYLPLEEELRQYSQVSRQDLEQLLGKYPFRPTTILTMLPD